MWILTSAIVYGAVLVATLAAIYRYEKRYSASAHVPISQKWVTMAWHIALSLAVSGLAVAVILYMEDRKFGVFVLFGILFLTMIGQLTAMMLGRGAAQRRS